MLTLEIITPQKSVLSAKCTFVTLPGRSGQFQVLAGHAPLMAEMRAGIIKFGVVEITEELSVFGSQADGFRVVVAQGFVEVAHDVVKVLCDAVAMVSEFEASSEEELVAQLAERMKKLTDDSHKEFKRLGAELKTLMTQL